MQIVIALLDLLFPPRDNERLLRDVTQVPYQPDSYLEHQYASPFAEPIIKAVITENKFHRSPRAKKLLARLLDRWLEELPGVITIIPVPLSTERYRERGYNQVSEVIRLTANPRVTVLDNCIVRTRHTLPQTSLSKADRIKNVHGVFTVKSDAPFQELADRTVVIVDDVVTTGATLSAVRATLTPHLPPSTRLISLALAH